MKRGLDRLEKLVDEVVPFVERPEPAEGLPRIANVVTTVAILPAQKPACTLPLYDIARQLQCCKYAPVTFAANTMRISDGITDPTVQVFRSASPARRASSHASASNRPSSLIRQKLGRPTSQKMPGSQT
jgi:TATA-box binding protein (TBP) (component of TFIID and TFIIIB)